MSETRPENWDHSIDGPDEDPYWVDENFQNDGSYDY